MNISTALAELREAKTNGFCPFCFSRAQNNETLQHQRDCKIINDGGIERTSRQVKQN